MDVANVKGTGKDGRVLKEDVQRHVARNNPGSPILAVHLKFSQGSV